jgi:3-phenylpropionate/cinnamic acid dioxygenase small subunit
MATADRGRIGRDKGRNTVSSRSNLDPREFLAAGTELVETEAICLDERRWDDWLALFMPDCEYWMPAWKSDDTLAADPRTELSYFYYAGRAGLEDRLARIRSPGSPASTPMPRTTHILGNIQLLDGATGERMRLRSSWVSHVYFPRQHGTEAFFGHSEHELVLDSAQWKIARKKIVLQNDYIPTMLDFYCI